MYHTHYTSTVTLFVRLLASVCLLVLVSCSTIRSAGLAAGGAAAGSLIGPGGAAGGAAIGVIASDLIGGEMQKGVVQTAVSGAAPQGATASTLHQAGNFISTVGWWYLILFILVPLLSKKGRTWFSNLATLHTTATKKDVDEHSGRLDKLEGMISSYLDKIKDEVS